MSMQASGIQRVVIISGPSGAGKSTVVRRLLEDCDQPLRLSVSATTRRPRPGELAGVDYHFLQLDEFTRRREAGEFLECKEVFGRGDWYGTLRSEVTTGHANGQWVILEIDVEGCLAALESYPQAVTIFLHPGSMDELERRLRQRGTEAEDSIARRLAVARREMAQIDRYRFQVVNRTVEQAVREICDILQRCGDS